MMVFSYAALLFGFWLLLSGHTDPLLIGLGLASVGLTMFLVRRMNVIDHESYPVHMTARIPAYWLYLFKEILVANIDVIKRIVSTRPKAISPLLIEVPLPQQTDLTRVIYANSITLTPGTVSVELYDDKILVHALTRQTAKYLLAGELSEAVPQGLVQANED